MSRLAGKVALITGGAGGMGASHVRRFAKEGARVVIADINEAAGLALAEELGAVACFVSLDVTSEASWQAALAIAEETFGRVDVLVNNAGVVDRGGFETFSLEQYRRVVDINQVSVFLGTKLVVPYMKKVGGGSIINISSIAGLVGRPETAAYTATKFAVRGMTKVAAVEFGDFGIRANSIHPGAIKTAMLEQVGEEVVNRLTANLAIKRLAEPEEVSSLAVFLASDESAYCTGAEFVIDGGLTSI